MGTTLEGCKRMIDACEENHVLFMIAENHRFLPAHNCVHDLIEQGAIGRVTMIRAYEGVNEIPGLSQSGFEAPNWNNPGMVCSTVHTTSRRI